MPATAKAVLATATPNLDLVACASTLRSRFPFVTGETKTFRIEVEKLGNYVFFVRREESPRQLIANVRGYGHSMLEARTMWPVDIRGSVSNQRTVSYRLGELDYLVRYETDGYLPEVSAHTSRTSKSTGEQELGTVLSSFTISKKLTTAADTKTELAVKRAGVEVPRKATFELKTRTFRHRDKDLSVELAPRLWLTQIVFRSKTWVTKPSTASKLLTQLRRSPGNLD